MKAVASQIRVALLMACGLLVTSATAQTISGIITGRVADPQGYSVPGAQVVLTQELTGVKLTRTTDPSGDFVFLP